MGDLFIMYAGLEISPEKHELGRNELALPSEIDSQLYNLTQRRNGGI